MTSSPLPRPGPDEYAEYYRGYVSLVPEGDIVATLERQLPETFALLEAVPREAEGFRYAPDKWSLRDVVGHVVDVERVFAFRALTFARGESGPLPGMDQDVWAEHSPAGSRPLADLLDEWRTVRRGTVDLFRSMDAGAGGRSGTASGHGFSVRAFPWIIAGHELHHRDGIRRHYLTGGG